FLAVIAALWLISPAGIPRPAPRAEHVSAAPVLHALAEGLRYAAREPVTRWLLCYSALSSLLGLAPITLLPYLVKVVYHPDARALGGMMAAPGLGALIGALFSAGVGPRLGWRASTSAGGLLTALGLIAFSRTGASSYSLALVILVVAGIAQVLTGAVG